MGRLTPPMPLGSTSPMNHPLLAIAVVALLNACGQGVPTCASDCAALVPTASSSLDPNSLASSCAETYTANQSSATAGGHGADFQALLTCIGNAGSFSAECAPLACGLTGAFGTPSRCAAGDAGR